jgi:hypothetical protein
MKKILFLALIAVLFPSCADEKTKPIGPVSESSRIPWNVPVAGQGGGQFSMLPQNQHRR